MLWRRPAAARRRIRIVFERTIPGSHGEYEAVEAMVTGYSASAPASARGRAFNSTQLRFRLAEALLRMPASTN